MEFIKNNATGVEVPAHKLVFFAAPKVASSSMKRMLYEVVHGAPFPTHNPDGSPTRIHRDFNPTRPFRAVPIEKYDDWTKITLVRDPVERLLSAYGNRVRDLRELTKEHVDQLLANVLGLKLNPPLYRFVRNLEKYRVLSRSITHHTDPFTTFLGHDLGFFDKVFTFDQLPELVEFISNHTGVQAALPAKKNQSKTKVSYFDLGPEGRKSILTYCAGDYALLKEYYNPPPLN